MPDRVLPALVSCPVVGVVLGDVGVDAGQGELLVPSLGDCLHYQLGIREGWLGLILEYKTSMIVITCTCYQYIILVSNSRKAILWSPYRLGWRVERIRWVGRGKMMVQTTPTIASHGILHKFIG